MLLGVMACKAFLVVISLCLLLVYSKDIPIPKYIVNLDLPAEERWSEIAKDYKDGLYVAAKFLQSELPAPTYEMLSIMGADLEQYFPQPYSSEMKSFLKYTNVTVGGYVLCNMFYELTAYGELGRSSGHHACTSIVAKMASGKIIHGRNLDYHITPLRGLAINVDFQRSGKTVYTGTTLAGSVGLMTGQKPNGFTISLDERDVSDWSLNAKEAMKTGTHGIIPLMIRDVLDDPDADFEKAVNTLRSAQIIAPCYIIVGGLSGDEGAVITQNRTMGIDVWRLNAEQGRWFLVETNYDHWKPPPAGDDRRDPAINEMKKIGQVGFNDQTLFDVLSTPPVLNDKTIYTTIMSASNPTLYKGWIRTPDN